MSGPSRRRQVIEPSYRNWELQTGVEGLLQREVNPESGLASIDYTAPQGSGFIPVGALDTFSTIGNLLQILGRPISQRRSENVEVAPPSPELKGYQPPEDERRMYGDRIWNANIENKLPGGIPWGLDPGNLNAAAIESSPRPQRSPGTEPNAVVPFNIQEILGILGRP